MSVDDETSGWQLTESDPGVFSELLKSLGVPLIVDDLYSLDADSLAALQPLRALIFLFKWIPTSSDSTSQRAGTDDPEFAGFFAHQVVNNACATLAVLNALGNIPSLESGPKLSELLRFSADMDPQTRGLVITGSDWLREMHNALSPPSAFSLDGLGLPKKAEEAYHFVVYLPVMGALYELDGLKPHALRHEAFDDSGEGWLKTARQVIEARINTYPVGALEFSLLALREDPLPSLRSQLDRAQAPGQSPAANELLAKISNENAKRERWAFENSLRRHNHVGLVQGLLLALAKGGKLGVAEESAKKAMKERIEQRRARGADMDEDE
ncbi:ubiquitin-specific protease [Crepidotus variabilis]|uniref:Ubiquitin carboxyl-terminal hydrolase n=1 Tax=Crepidotus variabilis TaxID=179855 RepID=A0A9P6EG73_9AGAR|nr:ubiquitin-specific protease [Crepidotus variabilis]